MIKKNNFLILRLQGPFQSYGVMGKWEYRDTAIFPTKSAIIGILGSALGYKRGSTDLISLSDSLTIAVRGDRISGILRDYQIVQGYHTNVDSLLNGGETKKRTSKIVNKYYLEDCAYLVILSGERMLLERLDKSLKNPKWSYTLGRSNCICSRPIYGKKDELYFLESEKNLEEVLKFVPLFVESAEKVIQYELEITNENISNYSSGSIKKQLDNVGLYVSADYKYRYICSGVLAKEDIMK